MTDEWKSIPAKKRKTWLGAVPGLVITAIGFVVATAPWMALSATNGNGPLDPATGWGLVIITWVGQAIVLIGVVVAIIGLVIKAFVDSSKNRKL